MTVPVIVVFSPIVWKSQNKWKHWWVTKHNRKQQVIKEFIQRFLSISLSREQSQLTWIAFVVLNVGSALFQPYTYRSIQATVCLAKRSTFMDINVWVMYSKILVFQIYTYIYVHINHPYCILSIYVHMYIDLLWSSPLGVPGHMKILRNSETWMSTMRDQEYLSHMGYLDIEIIGSK